MDVVPSTAAIGHALPRWLVAATIVLQDARLVQHFEEPILPPYVVLSLHRATRSTPMTHEHVKSATDKAKGAIEDSSKKQPEPEFDKPLGSSHNDELDLRDVVRKAAKKSQ
jgi:hypothetical protein